MFVITGGGSGIGKSLAVSLAKRNQSVLIIGRREHVLQETAALSSNIHYVCADITAPEGRDAIKKYVDSISHVQALVNNAGTLNPLVLLRDMESNAWNNALHTNLSAALFLPQIMYDKLTYGRVLNVGSGAAYFPIKGWAAYCVSKAALSMLTRCWQLESETIAFASVMPGISDTDMQAIARSDINPDVEHSSFYKKLKKDNRLVSPDTVAAFLTWLLLDVNKEIYVSQEWDIYDTKHHKDWLKLPDQVHHWDY